MPDTIAPLEYVNCDLCGSLALDTVYTKKSHFRGMHFSICRCQKCGLTFTNPRIPSSIAHEVYSSDYYKGEGVDENFKGETDQKIIDAALLVRSLEHALGKSKLRILDAGGGLGLVTAAARERGHDAEMSDLSQAAVDEATARGIPAHLGTPESLAERFGGQFDVVVALEVIEHVYSPRSFLGGIHRLLKPGGLFAFTTGNVSETRLRGENWGYFNIPEGHLYFFSRATVDRYLREAGFTKRISPYRYLFKKWWAVRLLEKAGMVKLPNDFLVDTCGKRVAVRLAVGVETVLGRRRFCWAIK